MSKQSNFAMWPLTELQQGKKSPLQPKNLLPAVCESVDRTPQTANKANSVSFYYLFSISGGFAFVKLL